jgi:AbrB family looped-hinge helix DNA binding protein
MMTLSVTEKGQIILPAILRKRFHIKKGSKLRVEESERGIMILRPFFNEPPEDPVEKTRGILKGKTSLLKSLLDDRKKEANRG